MYTSGELEREMYGNQDASPAWGQKPYYPPSPDRLRANLGQPLKHLPGEPTPLAMWCLFAACHGKNRAKLAIRFFGKAKRGKKPHEKTPAGREAGK